MGLWARPCRHVKNRGAFSKKAAFAFDFSPFKLILPFRAARNFFDVILNFLSYYWIYCINGFIGAIKTVDYDVTGLEKLKRNEWYIVVSNHQTMIDIIVLQKIFHGRIPFLKYFMKQELIWVPVLGLAWWALERASAQNAGRIAPPADL